MGRPTMTFAHGDHRRYWQGCRCADCRRGYGLHQGTGAIDDDQLRVTCWCEASIVAVPAADIKRGVTSTCGGAYCNRLHDRHRRAS